MVGKFVLLALFSTAALIAADAPSNPINGLLGSLGLCRKEQVLSCFILIFRLVRPPVSLENLLLLLLPQTLSVAFLGQLDPSPAPPSQQITAGTLLTKLSPILALETRLLDSTPLLADSELS
ncbi:hypothetical protein L596_010770 [Steinernema carpocapsae]|uniref:Secreted protein n=1 Tax=Steinernema carpocapsae TaxID=34508 RepID=A0A4U5PK36_STECR|nr:hypothetical protein L596_010770 [Steinernema carpocapsae]